MYSKNAQETETDPAVRLSALSKAIAKEIVGFGDLQPGFYPIDESFTVRLEGTLQKAHEQKFQGLPDVNWALAFALLAQRLKASRPDAKQIVGEVLRTVLACPAGELPATKAKGLEDRLRDVEEEIKTCRENARQPKSRAGSLTWAGEVAIIPH